MSDYLANCVSDLASLQAQSPLNNRSANVSLSVFRLAKNSLVFAENNAALHEAAEKAAEALASFATDVGAQTRFTFAGDSVFVCGQLLRASRQAYESALELGRILARAEVAEVCFEPEVTASDLLAFCAALVAAIRDPDKVDGLFELELSNVTVHRSSPWLNESMRGETVAIRERTLRFYATALVVVRRFYDDVARGRNILPQRLKRLAQQLVALADKQGSALLGMTALAGAHRDDAGRAVQSAILLVTMAREITSDRALLVQLAMAAFSAEVGRVRLRGAEEEESLVAMSDQAEALVPGTTAMLCVAMSGLRPVAMMRSVAAFETAWAERSALLGVPWGGARTLLPHSELLAFVRHFVELMAPRDMSPALSAAEAIDAMAADPKVERKLLRLFVDTLGLLPTGTVVELQGGAWAVVVGPSQSPGAAARPQVRPVTDATGMPLDGAPIIDLGTDAGAPAIVKILGSQAARFNVARAVVQSDSLTPP